jgi:zinc transport system permease protein
MKRFLAIITALIMIASLGIIVFACPECDCNDFGCTVAWRHPNCAWEGCPGLATTSSTTPVTSPTTAPATSLTTTSATSLTTAPATSPTTLYATESTEPTAAPPSRKTQIDWLIYGAGGSDTDGRNGADPDETVTGEFSYEFASEDGELSGVVIGREGVIAILSLSLDGEFVIAENDSAQAVLARHFARHFATLTRIDHFHDEHPLSMQATEEFPIELGSPRFMTFCYDATADGRMMRATTVGAAIGFSNNMYFVLPITIASAILLLCSGNNSKIKGDSALAMISVGSLAMGYLVLRMFSESANLAADICNTLFGSTGIVTISNRDLWMSIGLSAVVVIVFVFLYHKIFAITFDEDFAAATGTRARAYNVLLAVVVAIIIVLAMNIVGALLVSALIVFPALTAMRLFKNFLSVTICAVVVSMFSAAFGILVSVITDMPPGSTIVAVNIAMFFIFSLIGLITRRG